MPSLFIGHAGVSLDALFAIVELRHSFPLAGFVMYPFTLLMIIGFDLVTSEFCNKPVTLSKSVKYQWQKSQYHKRNLHLSKFSLSCPILKIFTKPKLSVGRQRFAIFVRFCLQRTLFLVVYHRRLMGKI